MPKIQKITRSQSSPPLQIEIEITCLTYKIPKSGSNVKPRAYSFFLLFHHTIGYSGKKVEVLGLTVNTQYWSYF